MSFSCSALIGRPPSPWYCTAFHSHTMSDSTAVVNSGRADETVLQRGGARKTLQVLKNFLRVLSSFGLISVLREAQVRGVVRLEEHFCEPLHPEYPPVAG